MKSPADLQTPADQPAPPRHRSFLHAVAGTAGVNVLISALGSVGGLLLARGLGPAARGDLATIIVWPSLIGTLTALGLPQATTYWISRLPGDRRQLVATACAGLAVLGAVVGVVGALAAPLISSSPDVILGLRVLFLLTPLVFVSGGLVSALLALDASRWNVARFIQPLVYFGGIAGLLAAGRLSVRLAVAAYALSIILQIAAAYVIARRRIGKLPRPQVDMSRPLLSYGVRAIASSAPWLINSRLDQLVLSVTVVSASLGNYAVAVSLSFLAGPIASAFGSIAFPRIAATDSETEARHLQRVAIVGCVLTAVTVLAPLALLAGWLVPFLFGPGYSDAVTPFRLLVPGTVAFAVNQVVGDILRGRGRPLDVAKAEGVGAVLTIGSLALLIPAFGINGAAAASSLAYAVVTALLFRALRKERAFR